LSAPGVRHLPYGRTRIAARSTSKPGRANLRAANRCRPLLEPGRQGGTKGARRTAAPQRSGTLHLAVHTSHPSVLFGLCLTAPIRAHCLNPRRQKPQTGNPFARLQS
jgi:hypothetical protein